MKQFKLELSIPLHIKFNRYYVSMSAFDAALYTADEITLFKSNEAAKQYLIRKAVINGAYCSACLGGCEIVKMNSSLNYKFYCFKCKCFYTNKSGTFLHSVNLKLNHVYALLRLWMDDFTAIQAQKILGNYLR